MIRDQGQGDEQRFCNENVLMQGTYFIYLFCIIHMFFCSHMIKSLQLKLIKKDSELYCFQNREHGAF